MISLIPPKDIKSDPPDANLEGKPPHLHQTLAHFSIEEREYIIIKDTKESKTWYCVQVLEKLPDRTKVSYNTTITPPLPKYNRTTYEERLQRIQEVFFSRRG
jgi:hypothetical protein